MNIKSINNIELTNIKSYNNVFVKNIHSVNNILQNYAFNLDLTTFKDTVTGNSLSCNIDGTRYDEVNGVTTAFGTDVPTIADKGLRICGAYSNLFLYSDTLSNLDFSYGDAITRNSDSNGFASFTAAQTGYTFVRKSRMPNIDSYYTIAGLLHRDTARYIALMPLNASTVFDWETKTIVKTGLLVSKTSIYTIDNDTVFVSVTSLVKVSTLRYAAFTISTALGAENNIGASAGIMHIKKVSLTNTKYYHPYIPTTTEAASSPSEAGNSATGTGIWIDDVQTKHPLLYSALQSAGTMTLKWKPGYSSADVTGKLNILSFDGVTKTLDYDADSQFMRFTDGTITLVSALTVVADTEYNIKVSWGNGTMQLSVDDSVPCHGVFSGFTVSDIYFGLNNEELQYISEFKVLKAEDKSLTTNTREFFFDVIATQTVTGVFKTIDGQTITVYWGDGTNNTYTGTTDQSYSKNYGSVGNRTVTIVNKSSLTKFTMTTTGANIKFNLKSLPTTLTSFTCSGSNSITGNLSDLPASLSYFNCTGLNSITGDLSGLPANLSSFNCLGSNSITGNLSDLPANLSSLTCSGSNSITGNLSDLPASLSYFNCTGSNSITGNLSGLPANLSSFTCSGSNSITGNLSGLPTTLTSFTCSGSNTISDYSGKTWANNQDRVYLIPVSGGGLSSAEIDQLLIDLAKVSTWITTKQVYLKGTNAARTSASDAAVATLESKGVTVTTN